MSFTEVEIKGKVFRLNDAALVRLNELITSQGCEVRAQYHNTWSANTDTIKSVTTSRWDKDRE